MVFERATKVNYIVLVAINDGLAPPSGQIAESPYRLLIYCRVPADWLDGEIPDSAEIRFKGPTLKPERLEELHEALYGKTWRSGNSDGSRYVTQLSGIYVLNPSSPLWPWELDDPATPSRRYFHFAVDAGGQLQRVTLAEL